VPHVADLRIRLADLDDARGIAECFDEAYAGTYPLEDFTNPIALKRRVADGQTVFAIAEEHGTVVAAVALEPADGLTGDFGHGVVRRSHRGLGLFARLHLPLLARARELRLATVHSQCVTSHVQSQRPMLDLGGGAAGLSLAAAPRDLRFPGLRETLSQRESFLNFCFVLRPRLRADIFAPESLRPLLAAAYASLEQPFRFLRTASENALPFTIEKDAELGTTTLGFGDAGLAAERLSDELATLELAPCIYARLPLASRGAPRTAEILRNSGFSFAAVLVGRGPGGRDALLLQRPRDVIEAEHVEVASEAGRAIKQLVFEDLAAVRGMVLA
jgi:hypothetical protein